MRRTDSKRRQIIAIIVSLFCVLFITLFSRVPTLSRVTHLIPLWSYTSHGHWKQIILNVALFIPLGYFLSGLYVSSRLPHLWTLLSALLVSASIELLQFFTYRGMLDVDDLISNLCGAAVGLLIFSLLSKVDKRRWAAWTMLAAGLIGCIMVAVPAAKSNISMRITEQFWFSVSSLTVDDKVNIEGECFLYDRATPDYTIFVGGAPATMAVDGRQFKAEVPSLDHKAEVEIQFRGRPVMPTGIWIKPTASSAEVEYVAGDEPLISELPEGAVLKAYSSDFDTFVYQDSERILWLIGTEIDKNTEVIYHIHTDESEKLPENRVQYGFDNRGFRAGAERRDNELESVEHYRVFEREIPSEYNVTAVVVGFNTDGTITWTDSFRTE